MGGRWDSDECLDEEDGGCAGPVARYPALSGSGCTYSRCEAHYEAYCERIQPRMDEINRRYPDRAPDDFDPALAGEVWYEEPTYG